MKSEANSKRSHSLTRPRCGIAISRCGGTVAPLTRASTGSRGSLSFPGGTYHTSGIHRAQGAHRSLKTLNTLEFQKSVFKALENLEFFTSP